MVGVQTRTPSAQGDLYTVLQQLSTPEVEQILSFLLRLRAQRVAPNLSARETELLAAISRGLPPSKLERYQQLMEKRDAETLTPDEHQELLWLTDEAELLEAERIENLVELTKLRGTSLVSLMKELGLRPPANG